MMKNNKYPCICGKDEKCHCAYGNNSSGVVLLEDRLRNSVDYWILNIEQHWATEWNPQQTRKFLLEITNYNIDTQLQNVNGEYLLRLALESYGTSASEEFKSLLPSSIQRKKLTRVLLRKDPPPEHHKYSELDLIQIEDAVQSVVDAQKESKHENETGEEDLATEKNLSTTIETVVTQSTQNQIENIVHIPTDATIQEIENKSPVSVSRSIELPVDDTIAHSNNTLEITAPIISNETSEHIYESHEEEISSNRYIAAIRIGIRHVFRCLANTSEAYKLFEQFITSDSKELSNEDLFKMLETFGFRPSEKEVTKMIEEAHVTAKANHLDTGAKLSFPAFLLIILPQDLRDYISSNGIVAQEYQPILEQTGLLLEMRTRGIFCGDIWEKMITASPLASEFMEESRVLKIFKSMKIAISSESMHTVLSVFQGNAKKLASVLELLLIDIVSQPSVELASATEEASSEYSTTTVDDADLSALTNAAKTIQKRWANRPRAGPKTEPETKTVNFQELKAICDDMLIQFQSICGGFSHDAVANLFRFMDKDQDGKISVDDIAQSVKHMNIKPEIVASLFREMDIDGNGTLDIDNFKWFLSGQRMRWRSNIFSVKKFQELLTNSLLNEIKPQWKALSDISLLETLVLRPAYETVCFTLRKCGFRFSSVSWKRLETIMAHQCIVRGDRLACEDFFNAISMFDSGNASRPQSDIPRLASESGGDRLKDMLQLHKLQIFLTQSPIAYDKLWWMVELCDHPMRGQISIDRSHIEMALIYLYPELSIRKLQSIVDTFCEDELIGHQFLCSDVIYRLGVDPLCLSHLESQMYFDRYSRGEIMRERKLQSVDNTIPQSKLGAHRTRGLIHTCRALLKCLGYQGVSILKSMIHEASGRGMTLVNGSWLCEQIGTKSGYTTLDQFEIVCNTMQIGEKIAVVLGDLCMVAPNTIDILEVADCVFLIDTVPFDQEAAWSVQSLEDNELIREALRNFIRQPHGHRNIIKVFETFDKQCDGFIDMAELGEALAYLGVKVTESMIDSIQETFDHDGNSKLDYVEFLRVLGVPQPTDSIDDENDDNNTGNPIRIESRALDMLHELLSTPAEGMIYHENSRNENDDDSDDVDGFEHTGEELPHRGTDEVKTSTSDDSVAPPYTISPRLIELSNQYVDHDDDDMVSNSASKEHVEIQNPLEQQQRNLDEQKLIYMEILSKLLSGSGLCPEDIEDACGLVPGNSMGKLTKHEVLRILTCLDVENPQEVLDIDGLLCLTLEEYRCLLLDALTLGQTNETDRP